MKTYAVLIAIAIPLVLLQLAGLGWLIGLVVGTAFAVEVAVLAYFAAVFVGDLLAARRPGRHRAIRRRPAIEEPVR